MATLASPEPPSPTSFSRRARSCARLCERCCCGVATYFPLAFVYGLSTWAVWVEAGIGLAPPAPSSWTGHFTSFLGILLYVLMVWSYTIAVFTDPGSPISRQRGSNGYSFLPTSEEHAPSFTSFTVSSSGGSRYCKKCQCAKPDRAHHCSTCKRCVMKMDHHCPWLATCVGLRNYKAFMLFLIYTCLFCWLSFFVTSGWVWENIFREAQYLDTLMPVHYVLLAVISGIIGLVLTGFTSWHVSLAMRGMTTIECLEKTRYLAPLKDSLQRQQSEHRRNPGLGEDATVAETLTHMGHRFVEAHANAIPGVTRAEEGEERSSPTPGSSNPSYRDDFSTAPSQSSSQSHMSPAQQSLAQHTGRTAVSHGSSRNRTYSSLERSRERRRYNDYLDETDSKKLPNAFDLGWRRNLTHLFGPRPILWAFPVINTTGDGWNWDVSDKWLEAREEITRIRDERIASDEYRRARRMASREEWGIDDTVAYDRYGERIYPNGQEAPQYDHSTASSYAEPTPAPSNNRSFRTTTMPFPPGFSDKRRSHRPSSSVSMQTLHTPERYRGRFRDEVDTCSDEYVDEDAYDDDLESGNAGLGSSRGTKNEPRSSGKAPPAFRGDGGRAPKRTEALDGEWRDWE